MLESKTLLIIHNAVVQGLSEAPFMKEAWPWGIFAVGAGLGNALFKNGQDNNGLRADHFSGH